MAGTGAEIPEFNPLPTRDFPLTDTRTYAVYLQDEISLAAGRLLLIPGVRYDRFEMNADSDAVFESGNPGAPAPEDFEDGRVSFKAGAIFRMTDVWSVYGQFTEGFRAPPYDDVNVGFTNIIGGYTTLPNSNLKPETSNGYEAGIRANGEAGSLSLAGYYNDYEDFIESLAVAGFNPVTGLIEFQSRNREEVVIKGIEFKGAWNVERVAPALDGVRLFASAAWSRGQDKELDEPLNSVDPAKGVFGIYWSPSNASWNTQFVVTAVKGKDRIDDTAAVTEFFATPGYVTLDLLGEYRFNEHLRINGGVFNLTDRKYWEWGDVIGREYNDPALGRFTRPGLNASVSLQYVF
jgi:hemoglobin/transferrin/lactoferrin receptor protein